MDSVEASRGEATELWAFFASRVDLWILPAVIVAAWFYFPYCEKGPNLCIWRAFLHTSCPGCGLTRAFCFLVHGRVREAVGFNHLLPVALSVMVVNFVNDARTVYWVLRSRLGMTRNQAPANISLSLNPK